MSELRERPRGARAPGSGPGQRAAIFGWLRPGPGTPREQLSAAFEAFGEHVARERDAAQLALVEVVAGDADAREQVLNAMGLYEGLIASSFAHAPDLVDVPPLVVKGSVSGIVGVTRTRLMDGRADELPCLG